MTLSGCFFFQAEDGIRDAQESRGLGDVYKRQVPKKKPDWEVPIVGYVKTGQFPLWMRALGKWDMTFRKGVFKLPLSHLFYVLGKR